MVQPVQVLKLIHLSLKSLFLLTQLGSFAPEISSPVQDPPDEKVKPACKKMKPEFCSDASITECSSETGWVKLAMVP